MDQVIKGLAAAVYLGMGRPKKYSHIHFRRIFAQELRKVEPAVDRARFSYLFNQVEQLARKYIRNPPALTTPKKRVGVVRKIAPAPGRGGTAPAANHPWKLNFRIEKSKRKPKSAQIPLF